MAVCSPNSIVASIEVIAFVICLFLMKDTNAQLPGPTALGTQIVRQEVELERTASANRQRDLNRRIVPGAHDLSQVFDEIRRPVVAAADAVGSLAGLAGIPLLVHPAQSTADVVPVPPGQGAAQILQQGNSAAATTPRPTPPSTTLAGFLVGQPYPFVMPPPDIPYFGSKWNGPWGYPIGHYQAFRGTGQYITHYDYYPLSYFGSLMAPFAYGLSGKK